MQLRKLSTLFTVAGAVLGALVVVGYALDLMPNLPEAVLQLVIYKLAFIGAMGLVVFGALLGRLARQRDEPGRTDDSDTRSALPEPPVEVLGSQRRDQNHVAR